MADGAESCGGLRDFAGVGGGGFLHTVDGEGVGVELEESVVSPDWGFWQTELTTP